MPHGSGSRPPSFQDYITDTTAKSPLATSAASRKLAKDVDGLYGDSRYTDLTITCNGRKWRVHKAIVCTRCDFLATAVNGRFKVRRPLFRRNIGTEQAELTQLRRARPIPSISRTTYQKPSQLCCVSSTQQTSMKTNTRTKTTTTGYRYP